LYQNSPYAFIAESTALAAIATENRCAKTPKKKEKRKQERKKAG